MGVVIETCIKYPGGPTRMTVTEMPSGVTGQALCPILIHPLGV
jgi:hypothetical protein